MKVYQIVSVVFLAAALLGCGQSPEQPAEAPKPDPVALAKQVERDRTALERAKRLKYYDACKAKNGDRHWGPFLNAYEDFRKPRPWYENGRFRTVKPDVVVKTDQVWEQAENRGACVILWDRMLSIDDGRAFTLTFRVKTKKDGNKKTPISMKGYPLLQ